MVPKESKVWCNSRLLRLGTSDILGQIIFVMGEVHCGMFSRSLASTCQMSVASTHTQLQQPKYLQIWGKKTNNKKTQLKVTNQPDQPCLIVEETSRSKLVVMSLKSRLELCPSCLDFSLNLKHYTDVSKESFLLYCQPDGKSKTILMEDKRKVQFFKSFYFNFLF